MATEDLTGRQDIPVSRIRTLQEGVEDVRTLLGGMTDTILPQGREVIQLQRENYQSRTFQRAAFDAMPERYGRFDRSLIIITFDNRAQTFIVTGRTSSGNPFEVMHATMEGLDLRGTHTVIYEYDGNETIVERNPTGEINTCQGEYGKPEALLPLIRKRLGILVGEEFIQPQEG
ncbi:MAG TPA: hypothetical protein VMW04_02505 [Patescibacteria group bacterium]|nr:hypothetical protein [Patescibacteria group bacterium]